MRDSFVFYNSFYEAIQTLNDEDAGACVKALANYALNGKMPEDQKPMVMMFFTLVKPQVDANNQKYENGLKGGRPKNQTETKTKPNDNQTETKVKPNVNDNVNVNVIEKEKINKKEKERFTKPTFDEVDAYCRERNNGVDADRFVSYYEANGWKVGKNPMKDWRAVVRTWERGTDSGRPAVTVETSWTAEDEARAQRNISIAEATKLMLLNKAKARYGA